MNQLTDIAAKIEAFPSGEYLIGEFPEVGDFSNALTTDEVKALAAEIKRLTDENARLREGVGKAIDDEPELPDELPEPMWVFLKKAILADDRASVTEAFRVTVRLTKKGIKERLDNDE